LEKREESLEKKEVRAECPMAEVSCDWRGDAGPYPPTPDAWLRCRFWPEWNVERLGTFLGNGWRLLTAGEAGVRFEL